MLIRRHVAVAVTVALAAGVLAGAAPAAAVQVEQPDVVSAVPAAGTPAVENGSVYDIVQSGSTMIAGGNFTSVTSAGATTPTAQASVMAFDAATGALLKGFDPVLNGPVNVVRPGADGTVYVGGEFTTLTTDSRASHPVNGLVRLRLSDGELYGSFSAPLIKVKREDGVEVKVKVKALEVVGSRLYVGGVFKTARGRTGLATLDAGTGTFDPYLDSGVAVNHNYVEGSGLARADVGVSDLDVSPDGTQLVAIGNFAQVDAVTSGVDQIARWDLRPDGAELRDDWRTTRFADACSAAKFDGWVRAVAFSPKGDYFVVVSSGGYLATGLCDTASRWETAATGSNVQPTWVASTGGDTLLSVALTGSAVYVGGHQRWMNNGAASGLAGGGAVPRPGVAALDPLTGLPLAWNPGRHPRGVGTAALYATPKGLWMGSDTSTIGVGASQQTRKRIAFFPLQDTTPRDTSVPTLPGGVYLGPPPPVASTTAVLHRVNAGGPALMAVDGGPEWSEDLGVTSRYRTVDSGTSLAPAAPYTLPIPRMDSTVPLSSTPGAVFADHRQDNGTKGDGKEMLWRFPVPSGKAVTVRLYFATRSSGYAAEGKRVFDILVDGRLVANDHDIFKTAGDQTGSMRSFSVTSDGSVDVQFTHEVAAPVVAALEVVATGVTGPALPSGKLSARTFDGTTAGATPVAPASSVDANGVRGATMIGGRLFYGKNDGKLYRRTVSGGTWSAATLINPHDDPVWSTVSTGSKTATGAAIPYRGSRSTFHDDLTSITSMWYEPKSSRLYYTLYKRSALYSRAFSPDSGVVHTDRSVVPGVVLPTDLVGAFFDKGFLYYARSSANALYKVAFTGTGPLGTPTALAAPAGGDWRSRSLFLGPKP